MTQPFLSVAGTALLTTLLLSACAPADNTAALQQLEQQVADLEAREAIRTLFADYGRTLDNRDFAAFGKLFAADSEYGGGGGDIAVGPDAIASQLEAVITQNASGANLHIFANEKITVNGDSASAISRGAFYVQDAAGQPVPLMWATYHDELIKEDGQWKFKRREVSGDIPGPSNEQRAATRARQGN